MGNRGRRIGTRKSSGLFGGRVPFDFEPMGKQGILRSDSKETNLKVLARWNPVCADIIVPDGRIVKTRNVEIRIVKSEF